MNKENPELLCIWRNIAMNKKIFNEITYINDVYKKLEDADQSVAINDAHDAFESLKQIKEKYNKNN